MPQRCGGARFCWDPAVLSRRELGRIVQRDDMAPNGDLDALTGLERNGSAVAACRQVYIDPVGGLQCRLLIAGSHFDFMIAAGKHGSRCRCASNTLRRLGAACNSENKPHDGGLDDSSVSSRSRLSKDMLKSRQGE